MLAGTSLVVHGLRLPASSAGGAGSVLGQPTKIPHATGPVDRQIVPNASSEALWEIQF